MSLFDDVFAATDPTPLDGYNGWSVTSTAGGVPTISPSGTLSMGSFIGASFAVQAAVSVADCTIDAPMTLVNNTGIGFIFRYADANNWYLLNFGFELGATVISASCYKMVAGVLTQVGTLASGPAISYGTPFAAEAYIAGDSFAAKVNGSTVSVFTDGALVAPGKVGLRNGNGGNGARTLTRFTVSASGAAPARNRSRRIQRSRRPW